MLRQMSARIPPPLPQNQSQFVCFMPAAHIIFNQAMSRRATGSAQVASQQQLIKRQSFQLRLLHIRLNYDHIMWHRASKSAGALPKSDENDDHCKVGAKIMRKSEIHDNASVCHTYVGVWQAGSAAVLRRVSGRLPPQMCQSHTQFATTASYSNSLFPLPNDM